MSEGTSILELYELVSRMRHDKMISKLTGCHTCFTAKSAAEVPG